MTCRTCATPRPVPSLSTHPFSRDSDAITTAVVDLEQRMKAKDFSTLGKASAVQASLVHLPPGAGLEFSHSDPFSLVRTLSLFP